MNKHLFVALYCSNYSGSSTHIIEKLISGEIELENYNFKNKNGYFYSQSTINYLLEEEFKHDINPLKEYHKNNFSTLSSGQKKKVLLQYYIDKCPDYILLDDVMGNIDQESQAELIQLLHQNISKIFFVQIFYKKIDLLPLANKLYSITDNLQLINEEISSFNSPSEDIFSFKTALPNFNQEEIGQGNLNDLVALKNVSVAYENKVILQNINWNIKTGEFWQLKGPNGSGKTTLVGLITGDNPKAYGNDIRVMGFQKGSGESVWQIKKYIGYFTPDMLTRFGRMDTMDKMIISGFYDSIGLYIKPTSHQIYIANQWITLLGLSHFRKRPFYCLSSAQQRLVMIARAMVKKPLLLILDEPCTGLNDSNTQLVNQLINHIAVYSKIAIIYISHQKEPNLKPNYFFELHPMPDGAIGKIVDFDSKHL
ncbi:MAG: ATP-binding cassette domain-containing protein [Cytophagales bacterium]|nr:MAG: ATP-binding cassette domain-containing protein [Cytophagales bacterium]